MLALSMTANGAAGQTLSEMEAVLGGSLTIEQLNACLGAYVDSLPTCEKVKLSMSSALSSINIEPCEQGEDKELFLLLPVRMKD